MTGILERLRLFFSSHDAYLVVRDSWIGRIEHQGWCAESFERSASHVQLNMYHPTTRKRKKAILEDPNAVYSDEAMEAWIRRSLEQAAYK